MRSSALRAAGIGLLAAVLIGGTALAGCARRGGGTDMASEPSSSSSANPHSATPAPTAATQRPTSSTELPTLKPPTGPPKTPTDNLPTDIVVGTIVAAKSPCFQLVDDEGRNYALYGIDTPTVMVGDTVRVKVAELTVKIYCGPGQPARIVTLDVVG